MSTCKYCKKDAGWLRSYHKECLMKHDNGKVHIVDLLASTAKGVGELESSKRQVDSLAAESFIDSSEVQTLVIDAFEMAVDRSLEDGFLSQDEEDKLEKYIDHFGLTKDVLNDTPGFQKFVKSGILREVIEGRVPDRIRITGNLPFNFQKSEQLIWVYQGVEYLQPRTRTTYQGASRGVSVRVAKGLYFRTGQFSGNPIVNTQITVIDIGILAITTKHIYFAGDAKSLRARYDKIISFLPFDDGVCIQRDGVAKQDVFRTGDGWFTYNLLMNLAQFQPA